MKSGLKCIICGSIKGVRVRRGRGYKGKPVCQTHMVQIWKHGEIQNQIIRDRNEFILKDGHYEFVCYNIKGLEKGRGKISIEDYELVKDYKWNIDDKERVSTRSNSPTGAHIRMHVLIMGRVGADDNLEVDHRNRIQSDNRRENLFVVNSSENSINRGLASNNSSGYIGVSKDGKREGYWRAHITMKDKQISKFGFSTKEGALLQRLEWEYKFFGPELSPQRDLFEEYGIGLIEEETDDAKLRQLPLP